MKLVEMNWNPPRGHLRVFAVGQFLLFSLIAARFLSGDPAPRWPIAVLVVSGMVGLVGLAVPRLIRMVYVIWMVGVFPIGWSISFALMAFLYFAVITPLGWLVRIFSHDPLQRKFDRAAGTYWIARATPDTKKGYFKQY